MNISRLTSQVVALGDFLLRFARVNRATLHPDGIRPETDSDHTVMLAVIGPSLAHRWNLEVPPSRALDVSRICQYAVVHDLAEGYAGDTNSIGITKSEKSDKDLRERQALQRIRLEFGADFPWLLSMLDAYEAQEDAEARFVRYLDKVTPKITHLLNAGAALRKLGIDAVEAKRLHDAQISDLACLYPEFPMLDVLLRESCDWSVAVLEREIKNIKLGTSS